MSQTSLRSGGFALRTLVPALMAVALVGSMPSWVERAHAQSYSSVQFKELFGPDGTSGICAEAALKASCDAAVATAGSKGAATAEISGQSSIDAVAAPVIATYQASGEIGNQVSSILAERRDGASGISFAGVKINGIEMKDGRVPLFEDSAASAGPEKRVGVFLNGLGGFGSLDSSAQTTGLDFHNGGLIAGVDYRFSDHVIAGASFNWIRTDTTYESNLGEATSDGYGGSLYASVFGESAYLDGLFNYTYTDYEMKRNISGVGTNKGSPHSSQIFFSMRTGYLLPEEPWMGGFRFGPLARLDVVQIWMAKYSESGTALALDFDKYNITSVTTNLGADLSYGIEMGSAVLTPRIYGMWVHEFENDAQDIDAAPTLSPTTPITTTLVSPDRNFGRLGAEISLDLSGGVAIYFDYEAIVGLKNVESNQFGLGGRIEF